MDEGVSKSALVQLTQNLRGERGGERRVELAAALGVGEQRRLLELAAGVRGARSRAELDELKERLVEAEAKAGSGGAVFGGDPAIDALLEGLAIESRRIHQQLYQSAQGGGVGMASGPPSYEQPGRFFNPNLAPAAYNYYHHQ